MRTLISSGSPYEPKVGISRAVRVGNIIAVSGTAPLGPDGRTVAIGDAAAQARRCLEIISTALEKAGASLRQVIRSAAKSALAPLGLIQDGNSRIWYDDHGWWAIVVEFQPSGWDRGSYLNVSLSWMLYEEGSLVV